MTEKLYYWAENLDDYSSDNDVEYDEIIEIKRLNFSLEKIMQGKVDFYVNYFKQQWILQNFKNMI